MCISMSNIFDVYFNVNPVSLTPCMAGVVVPMMA